MKRAKSWEVVIVILIVIFGLFAKYDNRPTFVDLEQTVLQEPFLDGRALLYRLNITILRNCTGALRREVRQGDETLYLPDRTFTWLPDEDWFVGKPKEFVTAVSLVDFQGILKSGPATYHVTQISHCNRIQSWFGYTVEEEYPPIPFVISDIP